MAQKRSLSEAVHAVRVRRGLTQQEYAARIGITQQALSKLEAGGGASAQTLAALVKRGGIRIDRVDLTRKPHRAA